MVVAFIPSRLDSTRFPGKALVPVGGVPLVAVVVGRVLEAGVADEVWLATDDARIASAVARRCPGARIHHDASTSFRSGSDRAAAAAAACCDLADEDVVLNVQGDEPLIDAEVLSRAVEALGIPGAQLGTVGAPLEPADADNPDVVKLIIGDDALATAFSRQRGELAHVGIYAFTGASLRRFAGLPTGSDEQEQGLEQLRALDNGMPIGVRTVQRAPVAVNRPRDLARVEAALNT
jgi:3-deoxy-manno-octulosonate cytidylyltransferase (CMP-KDO synthetase)